ALRAEGADVIDLGCLPDTPFPHLEQTVRELKARGLAVSVDSAEPDELRRGGAAGADYLLSLTERNLAIAEETGARPVLVPVRHGDLASLFRAAEEARKRGLRAILDPVLDPIHFGFADPHSRRTIQEHDAARRIMYAAAADHSLPRGYGRALLQVHERSPFPNSGQRS